MVATFSNSPPTGGHVAVNDATRSHFQDHENIKNSERGRHGDEEIASDNALRIVPHEGHPTLRRKPPSESAVLRQITSYRSWGHSNPQFQQQFRSDALFSPRWVARSHLGDELPQFYGKARPTAWSQFPPPEQPKAPPMPTEERLGLHVGQSVSPITGRAG